MMKKILNDMETFSVFMTGVCIAFGIAYLATLGLVASQGIGGLFVSTLIIAAASKICCKFCKDGGAGDEQCAAEDFVNDNDKLQR